MSDIYIPGVKSRFNTEKLIDDLMQVERIPRDRAEKTVENLNLEKGYWQETGRRITSLRESARLMYSFQNPFNERAVFSSDESVLTGTASREAIEQERSFTVKQAAAADRLLSAPMEESRRIDAGTYTFSVGEDRISFTFRGGSLREFADALNRRGRDKIRASVITVEPGTRSLLIESMVTGAGNRMSFADDAEKLVIETGLAERVDDARRDIALSPNSIQSPSGGAADPSYVSAAENTLKVSAGGSAKISLNPPVTPSGSLSLGFEVSTKVFSEEDIPVPQPPPGPSVPAAGSVTYGGITIDNAPSSAPIPEWTPPPPPQRVDDLAVLFLTFSDGSTAPVPPVQDSDAFSAYQYTLSDIAGGKSIASIELRNRNTHRDVSLRNVRIFDPDAVGAFKPRNAISSAQDAVVVMDGIEVRRPSNLIDDLIPGVSLTVKGASDRPVHLGIEPDRESVKDAIISLVGNYNRLMAEINVLTRNDDRIIQELSYLSKEEQDELKARMGTFSGDSTLNQLKNSLQRIASAPYPTTAEQDLVLLTQMGIGTDVRRSGASSGYDVSRLRGYLEIDEKALDAALQTKLPAVQQLFGYDTDGDLIVDSGIAYAIDGLARPFVETGGIISLKTGTIDSRIGQEERRIENLDRQLANKETTLKRQYGQMESSLNSMDRMSTSLDQFSQRANNNNR
ncbi:flagellar filament capping protein FliD [Treponema sp. OttesenSCG-928-L16]|nr:flagellar filament capping protein FliD [Treponema sp. OttesenSCG-928-L16]